MMLNGIADYITGENNVTNNYPSDFNSSSSNHTTFHEAHSWENFTTESFNTHLFEDSTTSESSTQVNSTDITTNTLFEGNTTFQNNNFEDSNITDNNSNESFTPSMPFAYLSTSVSEVNPDGLFRLTAMQTWFVITATLLGAVILLMLCNCLIKYRQAMLKHAKRPTTNGGDARVRRDVNSLFDEGTANPQTHVFYHPIFSKATSSHS